VQFYDSDNEWGPDLDYCLRLSREAVSVLDLGCGTGALLSHMAGSQVKVGIDPAAAMLDVARRRPGGAQVTWICGDARSHRLGQTFDLVVMTGHAFQVFLTKQDQEALATTIAVHLSPRGRFIFDSRNPAKGEWRGWRPSDSIRSFQHPRMGQVEAWNDVTHDPSTGIVTYQTHYKPVSDDISFSATSRIKFTPKEELAELLENAVLRVDSWLGDWAGREYSADAPEIIPMGGLR